MARGPPAGLEISGFRPMPLRVGNIYGMSAPIAAASLGVRMKRGVWVASCGLAASAGLVALSLIVGASRPGAEPTVLEPHERALIDQVRKPIDPNTVQFGRASSDAIGAEIVLPFQGST